MAKITLTASNVLDILKLHPEVEVEIAEHAIKNVTEGLKRRLCDKVIDDRIAQTIEKAIERFSVETDGTFYSIRNPKPTPVVRQIIESVVKETSTRAWAGVNKDFLRQLLLDELVKMRMEIVSELKTGLEEFVEQTVQKLFRRTLGVEK